MEGHPISAKRPRISVEESEVNHQLQQEEMEASSQKRWLCNELVWELCKEIPSIKTSDWILLTAHNMYVYLEHQFNKKLIYRDLIVFLKANLNAKKNIVIRINQVILNKESEPIVVVNQEQSDEKFELETNQFRIQTQIRNLDNGSPMKCCLYGGHFGNAHLVYFLRLIAPLIQPIRLILSSCYTPIEVLISFLNTQSDCIDSIALWVYKFDSEQIYEALMKYNKLQIYNPIRPTKAPKLVQWLTSNNNNNSVKPKKKYLFLRQDRLTGGLTRLIKELKKKFVRATSKSRFVILLKLWKRLDEFTLGNELTGEELEMRFKNIENGWYIYTLSRFPNNGLEDDENDCGKLDTAMITHICLS